MLDKKDLKAIEDLLKKNMKKSLTEFFDTLVLPYFEHNEQNHKEIKTELKVIGEHIEGHAKRISRLEAITSV